MRREAYCWRAKCRERGAYSRRVRQEETDTERERERCKIVDPPPANVKVGRLVATMNLEAGEVARSRKRARNAHARDAPRAFLERVVLVCFSPRSHCNQAERRLLPIYLASREAEAETRAEEYRHGFTLSAVSTRGPEIYLRRWPVASAFFSIDAANVDRRNLRRRCRRYRPIPISGGQLRDER
jgi:hypothetical protein